MKPGTGLSRNTPLRARRKPVTPRKPFEATSPGPVPVSASVRAFSADDTAGEARAKRAVVKSAQLRASARGEACTVEIPSVCNHDPDTVVLAHLVSELKGSKATDLSACFCCSACHDVLDRRVLHDWSFGDREFVERRAMLRTWTRWIELDLVRVVGHDGERAA